MPIYIPHVSEDMHRHISMAEDLHHFVQATVPEELVLNSDKKQVFIALYSLAVEHHGAILHLLKAGMFDGSALALTRPLIEAVHRAMWVQYCGKLSDVEAIRDGKERYPKFPDMVDAIEKATPSSDGLFMILKPFINSLHGYTHGGLEQLGRRFDKEDNVRATYPDDLKREVINATTSYLVMLAVAFCQMAAEADPVQEPRSAATIHKYNDTFGSLVSA